MRYGIFSDVHANYEALEAVMNALGDEHIDQFVCAGDVVGYGANPRECCQLVDSTRSHIVAGNHDWASVGLLNVDHSAETPEARLHGPVLCLMSKAGIF